MVMTSEPDDAADLVQETMARALQYKSKFRHQTNFKSWIFTIMRNIFINQYRRQKKWQAIHEQDASYIADTFGNKNDQYADSITRLGEINREINGLSEDLKTTFNLYNEGFKYEEIAEQLNIPVGTVKSRLYMARRKLMERVDR